MKTKQIVIPNFSVAKPYLRKSAVLRWIQFLISLPWPLVHYSTLINTEFACLRKTPAVFDLLAPEWDTKWCVWCSLMSMLQDLSAMEHKQNSCSSRQSVTTTQWAWHQVFRLASSCFSGCRMVFPLILNPQSENVCSALNSLIDQALHYPYSMKVLAEVIQLMLFPFQKIVLRLALTMPRLRLSHVWANLQLFSTTPV